VILRTHTKIIIMVRRKQIIMMIGTSNQLAIQIIFSDKKKKRARISIVSSLPINNH
jgi:hypothetical protein